MPVWNRKRHQSAIGKCKRISESVQIVKTVFSGDLYALDLAMLSEHYGERA